MMLTGVGARKRDEFLVAEEPFPAGPGASITGSDSHNPRSRRVLVRRAQGRENGLWAGLDTGTSQGGRGRRVRHVHRSGVLRACVHLDPTL